MSEFDVNNIRQDFPILNQLRVHDKPLVFLDNAASTQKPLCVIDTLKNFYQSQYANIHRGVYFLSEKATNLFEKSRDKLQQFINAASREEIIFVKGTTEAINLVSQSFVRPQLNPGDEIIISTMEHHANIIPWQLVCEQTGAVLKIIPITDAGEIIFEDFLNLISNKTKFISVVHVSNSLGTINPVEKIIQTAHTKNIPIMLDGAQAVSHQKVDMQKLDCDFYAFSGHKLYGPTGVGVLFGKKKWLEKMPPYQGGGEMIRQVTFEKTTYNDLPYKFEAGTPAIAEVIGLAAAIEYIENIGLDNIADYEKKLLDYAVQKISAYPDIHIIGTTLNKTSILSFIMDGVHPHDIGTILDQEGVAIRTGHHCCMPLMNRLNVAATARASFAFYNTVQEIDIFIHALEKTRELFHV